MSIVWRVGFNLIYKIVVFPTVMILLSTRFPRLLSFASYRPLCILSGAFVTIGLIADETILPRYGNLKSTLQGSIFMSIVSWCAQFLSRSFQTTWKGAILIGSILGLFEIPMHRWILHKQHPLL